MLPLDLVRPTNEGLQVKRSALILSLIALSGSVGAYVGIPSLSGAATPTTLAFYDSRGSGLAGLPHTTQLYDKADTNMAGEVCDVELDTLNNNSGRPDTGMAIIEGATTISVSNIEASDSQVSRSPVVRMVVPATWRLYVMYGEEGQISVLPTVTMSNCGTPVTTVPVPPTTSQPPAVSPITLPRFTG